jgi:hypothetical protein
MWEMSGPLSRRSDVARFGKRSRPQEKEKKPGSIVFILEQSGFSPNKELTSLKLIMLHNRRYYIFIDSPKGEALRGTGLPFHKDKTEYLTWMRMKSRPLREAIRERKRESLFFLDILTTQLSCSIYVEWLTLRWLASYLRFDY